MWDEFSDDVGRTPSSAPDPLVRLSLSSETLAPWAVGAWYRDVSAPGSRRKQRQGRTRGSSADEGVRPTYFGVCLRQLLVICVLLLALRAEIIDRIAVSVGTRVIAVSDLDREIRVTSFLNGVTPDFSTAAKHATAQRLIEQKLIQRELETSRYPVPDASEVDPILADFKAEHFTDEDSYRNALKDRGITEQQVRDELLWQRTLLRFIEVRFRPAVQVSDQEIQNYFEQVVEPAARVAHPGQAVTLDDYRQEIEATLSGQRVDKEVDTWLQEARKRNEIVVHEDALK